VKATGTFDVKLLPLSLHDEEADSKLGRFSIDKEFHGDLEATSSGEMLSARTDTEGSAGYVAIERVAGKLNGRDGSFVLQHSGTMTAGERRLNIMVVPDSGTDELISLSGTMDIRIEEGQHYYSFQYEL